MKNFFLFGFAANDNVRSAGILILRLAVAALMLTHGMAKLYSFADMATVFPDLIGIGSTATLTLVIFAEVGCSFALALGLLTRPAALVLVINMSVAAFVAHGGDPLATREPALLYLAIYATLFFTGAGRYSIDRLLFGAEPAEPKGDELVA